MLEPLDVGTGPELPPNKDETKIYDTYSIQDKDETKIYDTYSIQDKDETKIYDTYKDKLKTRKRYI